MFFCPLVHCFTRSSTSTAAAAFAIAISGSSNPRDEPPEVEARNRKESVVSSPATMRVLNVLRLVKFAVGERADALHSLKIYNAQIFRNALQ